MGDHIRLIEKKVQTNKGMHYLGLSDTIMELLPCSSSIVIGEAPEEMFNIFLVKIFTLQEFQKETMILWQIGEGLLSQESLSFFIYDDNEAAEEMIKGLRQYKSSNKTIVFTEEKEYKEIILSE